MTPQPTPTPPGRCPSCGAALTPLKHEVQGLWFCPSTKCPRNGRLVEMKAVAEAGK